MNFNRGDRVVHHSFGVGTVVMIEGMNFTGNEPRLFYRVEFIKTTVWVPVRSQPASGLRPLTPKDQLSRYRDLLASSPASLDQDFRTRQKALENRVEAGTFQSLCEIVRDLSGWMQQKPLNKYEKDLLSQSRSSLAAEWSATSGQEMHEALEEIDGYLFKGGLR